MAFWIKFLCWFFSLWPRSVVRKMGRAFGFLWFDLLRFRRRIVLENLQMAFPEWSAEKRLQVGREAVYRMGANGFEIFTLPKIDAAWVQEHSEFLGEENFLEAQKKGKGVYLLSLHMGSYDVAASLIAMRGQDLSLITKFFKNRTLNDLWFSIRGAKGMKFIEAHGEKTAFEILKAIRRKASVIFVLDQFMGRPFGIPTRFFGHETGTAYGLALFVLKTGSPVIPVYSVQGPDGKMQVIFEPEVSVESLIVEDKDESLRRITQAFNDVLEKIIRRYPEEWLWVHRRWKEYE